MIFHRSTTSSDRWLWPLLIATFILALLVLARAAAG